MIQQEKLNSSNILRQTDEKVSVETDLSEERDPVIETQQVLSAYDRGWQTFMGLPLEVADGVLVPRPETELLGNTAVELLNSRGENQRAIDMCCGSGNLTCGVAAAVPSLYLWASDLTDACVQLARRNVERLGLAPRVTVAQGDLFAGLAGRSLEGSMDVILCNPPYIASSSLETERSYLLENEAREAFDGGPYGISIYQRVIRDALTYLKPDGWLLFEIGEGQEKQLKFLFQRSKAYSEVRWVYDAKQTPRVAVAQRLS